MNTSRIKVSFVVYINTKLTLPVFAEIENFENEWH